MALITKESVYVACDAIVARGGKVSWNAVKAEHGGRGSPNDGLPHLKQWRADQAAQLATAMPIVEAPALFGEPTPPPKLPEVTAALDALGHAISVAAARVQAEERRSSDARLNALAGLHAEGLAARDKLHADAVAALGLRLSDAEADLDDVTPTLAEAETLRERVAVLEAEGTVVRAELAAATGDLVLVRAALAEASEGRTAALAAADHVGAEALAWKAQLERVQGELAGVRGELATAMVDSRAAAAAAAKEAAASLETLRNELTTAVTATRADAAVAAKEASDTLEKLRGELSEAVAAARLSEQRLTDAQAAEGRERTARERAEERAVGLVERAIRAEAELSLATRQTAVPLAATVLPTAGALAEELISAP